MEWERERGGGERGKESSERKSGARGGGSGMDDVKQE